MRNLDGLRVYGPKDDLTSAWKDAVANGRTAGPLCYPTLIVPQIELAMIGKRDVIPYGVITIQGLLDDEGRDV